MKLLSSLLFGASLLFVIVGGVGWVGCASPTNTVTKPGDMANAGTGTCSAGSTKTCFCLGGGQGNQVCRSDGMSYGSCMGCAGGTGDGGITIADGGGNACGVCAGCCNGTTCVPYAEQGNSMCGAAGTTCAPCSAKTCDGTSGTCVSANDCSSCTSGCCGMAGSTPHCYTDTPSNCGTGGGSCMACPNGTLCSNGVCNMMIDPTVMFLVTVSTAKIYNTESASGGESASNCWDGFDVICDEPDVAVCFAYGTGSNLMQGCTTTIDSPPIDNNGNDEDPTTTDTATWTGTDGQLTNGGSAFYIPGSAFTMGQVTLTVYDEETVESNQIIGSMVLPAASMYQATFMAGPFQRVVSVSYSMK